MIYIGSDHGGFQDKEELEVTLSKLKYEYQDIGPDTLDKDDDYPQFAQLAVQKLLGDSTDSTRAILLCRGGQGMAIAANRHAGIRAVVVTTTEQAKKSRIDNDSNVLCLPSDALDAAEIKDVVKVWLETEFSQAPRHVRRLKEIDSFYPFGG